MKHEIEELKEYKFKVVDDITLPYKLFKDDNGKWMIRYCNEIHMDGDVLMCTKSSFDTIKNNKIELDKFKDWLNTNRRIETVYTKDI